MQIAALNLRKCMRVMNVLLPTYLGSRVILHVEIYFQGSQSTFNLNLHTLAVFKNKFCTLYIFNQTLLTGKKIFFYLSRYLIQA